MRQQNILFLVQLLPYPLNSGGKIANFKTLEMLSKKHRVDLVCQAWSREDYKHLKVFRQMTRRLVVLDIKRKRILPHFFIHNLLGKPYYIYRDVSQLMKNSVQSLVQENKYDLVIADIYMAPYVPENFLGKKILEKHNIDAELVNRYRALRNSPITRLLLGIEASNLRRFELKSSARTDFTIVFTEKDKQWLVNWGVEEQKIVVIPPGTKVDDVDPVETDSLSKDIVHIGTGHWPPNVDGLLWFVREIFPRIVGGVPEAKLRIIGKEPPRPIQRLHNGKNIFVYGYVEDLAKIDGQTAAFIVPLRMGGGIRIKILEALAKALPIVTTSVGCEGIGVESGRHLLISDTAEDFARSVTTLLLNPSLRKRLGEEGRTYIRRHYSGETRRRLLTELILRNDY